MTFTCNLQVCLGSCAETTCTGGGWGRKKRDVMDILVSGGIRNKRAAGDSPFDDINVGSTLRVVANKVVINGDDTTEVCIDKAAMIVRLVAMLVAIGTTIAMSLVIAKKMMTQKAELKALNSKC